MASELAIDDPPVAQRVALLQELPPLPSHTQRLLAALGDPEIEVESLATLIDESPPLAARIVGLARSAFFGSRTRIHSVKHAIIHSLGLDLVKSLASGIAISGALRTNRCPNFREERYWASALLCASLARTLTVQGRSPRLRDPDLAYLAGLLHNLGILALVHVAPMEMEAAFQASIDDPARPLSSLERDLIGIDHGSAGAILARRWRLPDEVVEVTSYQRREDPPPIGRPIVSLISLVSMWVEQKLLGIDTPWMEPESARDLGLDPDVLDAAFIQASGQLDHVVELAALLSSRH